MEILAYITSQLQLPEKSIRNTIRLLDEDSTIPFISRYRKEMTGNLDEVQIGAISKMKIAFEELEKRKKAILKAITEQDKLTPELQLRITNSTTLTAIEDIYLPFKKKRSTKAAVAREKGLEPLAKIMMKQRDHAIEVTAARFINEQVKNEDEALQGARDIVAEWINENERIRNRLRKFFNRKATIVSKVIKDKEQQEEAQKYHQYFDWSELMYKCPSHRL